MDLQFYPKTIFRGTPLFISFDERFDESNFCNVVIHSKEAISPQNEFKDKKISHS